MVTQRTLNVKRAGNADAGQVEAPGEVIRLRDGRRLAYAEFGDPAGVPVVLSHGLTDSRLSRHPDDGIAAELGVRLIGVDRPGVGLSDYKRKRRLLDWADDVVELADALNVDRFAVLGHSAGGPYALAAAYRLPERVTAVGVASGFAPFDRPNAIEGVNPEMAKFFRFCQRGAPISLVQAMMSMMMRPAKRDFESWARKTLLDSSPQCDREVLESPEIWSMMVPAVAEGIRGGGKGLGVEMPLITRPWGFRLEEIRVPVHLWHGDADTITPLQMGRYLAQTIPQARLTVYPNEGHQLMYTHWREILKALRHTS